MIKKQFHPWTLPKWNKNLGSQKDLYKDSSLVHVSEKL